MINSTKNKKFFNKPAILFIFGLLISICFYLSYNNFLKILKKRNYEVFDFNNTLSWEKYKGRIFRKEARGDFDSLLTSVNSWKKLDWSFIVRHPKSCAVVFDYKDDNNLQFIYFNESNKSILWILKKDNEIKYLDTLKMPYSKTFNCKLKVDNGIGEFYIENVLAFKNNIGDTYGKIGYIIRDSKSPKTSFVNLSLKGKLANGENITVERKKSLGSNDRLSLFLFVPICFSLILLSFYLSYILPKLSFISNADSSLNNDINDNVNIFIAGAVHLLFTIILFWPFVFKGHILLSSSDNYGQILPLFFYSKQNFINILSGKSLELWNPYLHNGIPFFSNHWSMIYYPLNWLIFMFKDQDIFLALTFRQFIEVFLIGILAYGFFCHELKSRKWALFCSIIYQLNSLLIFTLTIFPSISLFFSVTLYLYLLWSMSKRKPAINYILLTFSVYLIMTSANVAFIFYAIISLFFISFYRIWTSNEKIIDKLIVIFSFCTGMIISSIRMLPCLLGILDSNRIVENYFTIHDRVPFFTRLFVPEIAGRIGYGAMSAVKSANINFIFTQNSFPFNAHNTFFVYFGVIPAILLIASLFIKGKRNFIFWRTYSFIGIALGLLLHPFWGFLSILFFPLNHYQYYIIILPVGLCALFGHICMYLEENELSFKDLGKKVILSLVFVQVYILIFITYLFPNSTPLTRMIFAVGIIWYVVYKLILNNREYIKKVYLKATSIISIVALWISLLLLSYSAIVKPLFKKDYLPENFLVPTSLFLFSILFAAVLISHFKKGQRNKSLKIIIGSVIGVLLISITSSAVVSSSFFERLINSKDSIRVYTINFLLSNINFIIIASIGLVSVILLKLKIISKNVFWFLLIIVTSLDLLMFNAKFENIATPSPLRESFSNLKFPYQDISSEVKSKMDLKNYRCSNLDKATFTSNKNIIYRDISSYTGIIGYMPKRFSNFVINFGYPKETIMIYPADSSQNQRFLDLSGVRYIFKNEKTFYENPTALSRLTLFYFYEVISDENKVLDVLKDKSFNPRQKIILSEKPNNEFKQNLDKYADYINISNSTSDEVVAFINSELPGVLLFNDTYHKGWCAYVDGIQVPIYHANYNFMACVVDKGRHKVKFKFEPDSFYLSLIISIVGIIIFLFGIILLAFYKKNNK